MKIVVFVCSFINACCRKFDTVASVHEIRGSPAARAKHIQCPTIVYSNAAMLVLESDVAKIKNARRLFSTRIL